MTKKTKKSLINIGSNVEMSIKNYANLIKKKIDPRVLIKFDNDKNLIDVCLNPNKTVRSYMHSNNLNYVCSCSHFNEKAQPYISSYLLRI